jgi:hypothetical protein
MHPGPAPITALCSDPLALTAGLGRRLAAAGLAALAAWAVVAWAW